jgi:uncharacterized protein YndB with AHSA1/START domain
MDKSKFEYVSYISTTPDNVWNALIDPGITPKYWQQVNLSDWTPGSKWEHRSADQERILRLVGKVIEFIPSKKLVLTWALPADEADESKHSRVTFNIEPYREIVFLKVTHDQLEPGSEMLDSITEGWPMVISSLKTLLETGHALPKLW